MTAGLLTAGAPVSNHRPPTQASRASSGPHQTHSALRAFTLTLPPARNVLWPAPSSSRSPTSPPLRGSS